MLREHLPEDLLGVGDGLLWKLTALSMVHFVFGTDIRLRSSS